MEKINDENKIEEIEKKESLTKNKWTDHLVSASLLLSAIIIAGGSIYSKQPLGSKAVADKAYAKLGEMVLPSKGFILPVRWGDLGKRLVEGGVVDRKKIEDLYAQRGGLDEETNKLLIDSDNGQIRITKDNANTLLNLFWALGLANKNVILEKGPMTDKKYGGDASKFASTGGWTLSSGNPMGHYSRHVLVRLTPEQQLLVERVSQNIYRPCCGNSTYFPDCNHGMAMLGLLELMASQGVSERDMYKVALQVNAYWFPDTYLTIAKYLEVKGLSWQKTDPKELLGASYSSSAGYQKILSQVSPQIQKGGGGSCGV